MKKYRWSSDIELYDNENLCDLGYDSTIKINVETKAEMMPAEPDVGIKYDEWYVSYDFKPISITIFEENGNEKDLSYESLSESSKEKVMKFCNDNKDEIEEKADQKSPKGYDIEFYQIS